MNNILDHPFSFFVFSFALLWLSAYLGAVTRKKLGSLDSESQQDFGVIQGVALTLLGLLIGFTF